jgi:hypothetical protein
MNRRNFLGSLVGGIATAAAVRTWPFRVYSFPSELKIFEPALGQMVYTTTPGGSGYFLVNDVITLHPAQAYALKQLGVDGELFGSGMARFYRVTAVDREAKNMTIEKIVRQLPDWPIWHNLSRK